MVVRNGDKGPRVLVSQVEKIISNRNFRGVEQFLVQWKTDSSTTTTPPLSWHGVKELVRCLDEVQAYIDIALSRPREVRLTSHLKRKSPDDIEVAERRPSPFERHSRSLQEHNLTRDVSDTSSTSLTSPARDKSSLSEAYNGVIDTDDNGFLFCRQLSHPSVPSMDIRTVTSPNLPEKEFKKTVYEALTYIRAEYVRRLGKIPGPPIHLLNFVDVATPSLRFKFISDYQLTEGVYRMSSDTQQGCMQCSPHMGRNIGCEYTKKCDCLEYAAVDEARISDPQMMADYQKALSEGGSTFGFPKKFPYFAEGTKRQKEGCLVPFYLHSRRPIYECNDKCKCGPNCRNKNVQFGRSVELEIFRTVGGRGWGLRCREDLYEGQFIDTYRGEIITDAEATRREMSASKAKGSYLYALDKFAESEGIPEEELYVVDGEFMGGPTKFINHSCDPNCRQYTVSYNKHDPKVYDIAFFACRFIPKNEELTFDYLDKEEGEEMEQPGEDAVPCLCGAANCRKWLWT